MKIQQTITVNDLDGNPAITLTTNDTDKVKIAYEGLRFNPPVVSLKDLDLAVMALRGGEYDGGA